MDCYGCGGPDEYPVWPPATVTHLARFATAGSHSGSQGLCLFLKCEPTDPPKDENVPWQTLTIREFGVLSKLTLVN